MSSIEEKYVPDAPSNFSGGEELAPVMSFMDNGNQFVLDCLTNLQQMETIADDWQRLEKSNPEPYIYFQSYNWCSEWVKEFADQNDGNAFPKVKIYVLSRNNEVVMIWPMMIVKSRTGLTNLTFLTEPHGQYGNIICQNELVPLSVGRQVWKYICKSCKADTINMDQYPKNSFLKQIIDNEGLIEKSVRYASILNLAGFENWEQYYTSLNKKNRKKRKQRRNKMSREGDISFQTYGGNSEQYRDLVSLALQWKNVWLNETGRRATVLSQDTTKNFIANLDGKLGDTNALPQGAILGALMLDDKPIAIEIGMCLDGHYYCYLGAFDWDYKHLSPGNIQMEESQKWAKSSRLKKFDFLGDPADYKSSWTNETDELESRTVPITLRGFLYGVFWKAYLRPAARYIFNKMKAENRSKLLNILGISEKGTPPPLPQKNNSETDTSNLSVKSAVTDQ